LVVDGINKKANGRYLLNLVMIAWGEGVRFGRVKTQG
jgi:hypothetical protein